MSAYSRASNLAAYQAVATHGGVAASDPHQLITLLLDGALDRLQLGRSHIERGMVIEKAATLRRVVEIISELRASLDHSVGGTLPADLERLYDYMTRRVLLANLQNDIAAIDEVVRLLREIRNAWVSIPAAARAPRK